MSGGNDKLERDLEAFLGDDSRVAALYRRLPKDEPDATLDAAILAQARAAVAPRRVRPRWLPAMGAAAAIVIAAGLAYRIGPQVWTERSAVSEKAEQRVAAPASAPVPQQMPSDASAQNAPLPQAPTPPTKASSLETQSVTGSAMRRADVEPARDEAKDKLRLEKQDSEDRKAAAPAFAKQAAQGHVQTERQTAVARDELGAAAAQRETPARAKAATPTAQLDAAPAPRFDAAPAPPLEVSPATPAAMAVPAPKPAAPEPSAFPTAAGVSRKAAAAPPPPAAESAQSVADIESTLYPEHWVSDIQKMLKDGRRDDAIRNLVAFRKRYPDYTLPDDLRDLK